VVPQEYLPTRSPPEKLDSFSSKYPHAGLRFVGRQEKVLSLKYSPLAGRKEGFPLTDVVPGFDAEALEDRSRKTAPKDRGV
jgi:hypothetical protein